jgi:hypothetical protein
MMHRQNNRARTEHKLLTALCEQRLMERGKLRHMWQLNQIIKPGRMGSIMTMMMMICAAVTARPEGYSRHRTVPNLITHLF